MIELMVVMFLVSLLAGVALPFGVRAIDNSQRRGAVADLGARLSSYPLAAYYSGRALEIDQRALRIATADLPGDCAIGLAEPLRYDAGGLASGGEVTFKCDGDAPRVYRVARVTGAVQLVQP